MLAPYYNKNVIEAGCDEAGRGCLAGPVFAAAVILPHHFSHPLLNDSKQVSEANRDILRTYIEENAIDWQVVQIDVATIDSINILNAAMKAMHLCIDQLRQKPELLLIDGKYFPPYFGIPHQCIIKGDAKFAAIAAASILAKTHRDDYMRHLHTDYPQYNWQKNKGYGTLDHRKAILKHGICPHHRSSFNMGLDSILDESV